MFVGNWGNSSDYKVAGSGKFLPPSITVYSLDANGDVAPLRTIQGPKTQLDWMGAFSLDPETGNLWVANDVGNSVLVFRGDGQWRRCADESHQRRQDRSRPSRRHFHRYEE